MKVAVIGGGPSGLVTLKYLSQAHHSLGCEQVDVRLFEYESGVGGTFRARAYEDAELVSSKQLTTFSDFRCTGSEDFLKASQYVEYLEAYSRHFALNAFIRLNTRVLEVKRRGSGGHTIVYVSNGGGHEEWDCDAVAVCSGLHVEPHLPRIDGITNVPRVIHSSEFKSRDCFASSQTVMVVGCGETGADIAHLAVTTPSVGKVILCHRDGFHFAPKRNPGPVILPILWRKPDPQEPGIPIDVSRANLFDTAYVHSWLRQNDSVLWWNYKWYIKILLYISSGTTAGMDQWIGDISPERHHPSKIFFNKSMKAAPYISQPYRPSLPGPRLWIYALRSALVQTPIAETHGRQIELAPWPKRFDGNGIVSFQNNKRPEYARLKEQQIKPDTVVLCTGYQQRFDFFRPTSNAVSLPYPTPDTADVRRIWCRHDPTVGFIGFVRPSLGAIPPLAEMQSQLWILNLLAPERIWPPLRSEDEPHYRLKSVPGARVNYDVDHESYVYQLALDMNSAPGILDIFRIAWEHRVSHWVRLLLVWALGANFNTKCPWEWRGAANVLTSDEIWETITRRPILFGHLAVSLLPMSIFGPISLICFLCSAVVDLFKILSLTTSAAVNRPAFLVKQRSSSTTSASTSTTTLAC